MGLAVASLPECSTFAETERKIGVSKRAVRQMVAAGELRTVTIPGYRFRRVLQSSIDDLLAKVQASAEQAS